MSTITSVRNRDEDPRRDGRVIPVNVCSSDSPSGCAGGTAVPQPLPPASGSTGLELGRRLLGGLVDGERFEALVDAGLAALDRDHGSPGAAGAPSRSKIACRSGSTGCWASLIAGLPRPAG